VALPIRYDAVFRGRRGNMSGEQNKAVMQRLGEIWNKGDLAVVDEVFGADYVGHLPDQDISSQGIKQGVTMYRTAFPDFHVALEDMVAEGDKVAARWTGTGTHSAEFRGVAATGKRVTFGGMWISRLAGGKVVEDWFMDDDYGLMRQLGAIPTPE